MFIYWPLSLCHFLHGFYEHSNTSLMIWIEMIGKTKKATLSLLLTHIKINSTEVASGCKRCITSWPLTISIQFHVRRCFFKHRCTACIQWDKRQVHTKCVQCFVVSVVVIFNDVHLFWNVVTVHFLHSMLKMKSDRSIN